METTAASRYSAAWRDRKRRMVVFKTVQFLFFPMVLGARFISSKNPCAGQRSMSPAPLAFLVWFLGYILVGIWLNRLRCPRCGKLYDWRLECKGALERQKNWRNCHHCGLQQARLPSSCEPRCRHNSGRDIVPFCQFIDSKSVGAYTRRGQLSWLGVALRARQTCSQVKIEIAVDRFQFLGKAVKIGHGPATVIGCRWESRWFFAAGPAAGSSKPPLADSQSKRKSGNLPELVEADTLRARECGETPRSFGEAFLLHGAIFDGDQNAATVSCNHADVGLWCVRLRHG
jgi:hypothetical protein